VATQAICGRLFRSRFGGIEDLGHVRLHPHALCRLRDSPRM
jgi:hypothetical protein